MNPRPALRRAARLLARGALAAAVLEGEARLFVSVVPPVRYFDDDSVSECSGPRRISAVKPAGKRRVLLLGDSYTFGAEAAPDETFPCYLASMIPGADVINLGVSGYGQDQMLLALEERGLDYRPDVVVRAFIEMDVPRDSMDFFLMPKPRFL